MDRSLIASGLEELESSQALIDVANGTIAAPANSIGLLVYLRQSKSMCLAANGQPALKFTIRAWEELCENKIELLRVK
jgi:ABC-type tungstate transport system substrate-binding protein